MLVKLGIDNAGTLMALGCPPWVAACTQLIPDLSLATGSTPSSLMR